VVFAFWGIATAIWTSPMITLDFWAHRILFIFLSGRLALFARSKWGAGCKAVFRQGLACPAIRVLTYWKGVGFLAHARCRAEPLELSPAAPGRPRKTDFDA
jgi:hypothetical protein